MNTSKGPEAKATQDVFFQSSRVFQHMQPLGYFRMLVVLKYSKKGNVPMGNRCTGSIYGIFLNSKQTQSEKTEVTLEIGKPTPRSTGLREC